MNIIVKWLGFGFILLWHSFIMAQSAQCDSVSCDKCICCASIDPTPAGQMISHVHEKNEWMVSVRPMQMNMDGLLHGNQNDMIAMYGYSQNNMQMNMYMLMLMYGINNKLTVMAMASYNTNYMEMTMYKGSSLHKHGMQTQGVGDTKLSALYAIIKKPSYHLLASGGVSLPTGNIHIKGKATDQMYANTLYPNDMQTGSGSFEALPGVCYLLRANKITYSAQLSSVIRLNKNSLGYKYGNEASISTWVAYQVFPFLSTSLRAQASTIGYAKGYNSFYGGIDDAASSLSAYSGQLVNTYLGINLRAKKGAFNKLTLGFEYGLPVYQNLYGTQLKTKQLLNASLAFRF